MVFKRLKVKMMMGVRSTSDTNTNMNLNFCVLGEIITTNLLYCVLIKNSDGTDRYST